MKKIKIEEKEYELIKEYKDGFDNDELQNKYTEYFDCYDYIVGDWSYGKLRLKGFCDKNNSLCNSVNDYASLDDYIRNQCAYECKYFVLKKSVNDNQKELKNK